ncbi:MAG: TraB/GumN family protein [Candidatus Diapherotrites archaeon]|nr:TraB/GumN family protein [Candidatus Diapherotrites archaeon]
MIERIKLKDREIILVGTAHISKESIKLVEETIDKENPDIIGIELDKERIQQLLSGQKWEQMNIVEVVKSGKTHLFLLNVLLSNIQKQLGIKVGVKPGAEMLVAVRKAQEKKIPIQLLDRDVRITLKRAFDGMKLIEKLKLGYSIIAGMFGYGEKITAEKIEELKQEDVMNKLMKELGGQLPSIKHVLVDERDLYIAEMIKRSPAKKIVAVVGAGHLKGIKETILEDKKVNLTELETTPKKTNYFAIIGYLIPFLFISMVAYAFWVKGIETTVSVLAAWFLVTGGCSAIGALLARAHPLSIITAFLAAPFTTLHPLLAAGWFSALAETRFNPPKVIDFENLSNISSISGFYKNKVTHLLIVAALTNLGATIGTLVALPYLVSILA